MDLWAVDYLICIFGDLLPKREEKVNSIGDTITAQKASNRDRANASVVLTDTISTTYTCRSLSLFSLLQFQYPISNANE